MKQFILIFFAGVCLLANTEHIHAQIRNNDSTKTSTGKSADSSVDELIDRYELLLNEILPIAKQYKAGDTEAQQKYTDWMEKAQPLINEMTSNLEKFTPEQLQRFTEISEKVSADINMISGSNTNQPDLKNKSSKENVDISTDCKGILDKYESWVDHYILVYPKVMEGDMEAIVEMQSMAEEIQAITRIMSDCSSGYSKEEMDRIQQIADKLSKLLSPDK